MRREEERLEAEAARIRAEEEERLRQIDEMRAAQQAKIDRRNAVLQRLTEGKSRKQARAEELAKVRLEEELKVQKQAEEARARERMMRRHGNRYAIEESIARLAQSNTSALHRISQSSKAMAELARREASKAASVQAAARESAAIVTGDERGSAMSAPACAAAAAAAAAVASCARRRAASNSRRNSPSV